MNHRLNQEIREETETESSTEVLHDESLVFESADAAIRHDANGIGLPPQLRERVMDSISREAPPKSHVPWWKRWSPF